MSRLTTLPYRGHSSTHLPLASTFPVTVGTQAAVLAGLDITMFIEFNPPHNDDWVSTNLFCS